MPARAIAWWNPRLRHHRDDDGVVDELARVAQLQRRQREQAIAVDDVAVVVDGDHAVAVAVERETEVGAALRRTAAASEPRRVAPQRVVDVAAVRRCVDHRRPSRRARANARGAASLIAPLAQSST